MRHILCLFIFCFTLILAQAQDNPWWAKTHLTEQLENGEDASISFSNESSFNAAVDTANHLAYISGIRHQNSTPEMVTFDGTSYTFFAFHQLAKINSMCIYKGDLYIGSNGGPTLTYVEDGSLVEYDGGYLIRYRNGSFENLGIDGGGVKKLKVIGDTLYIGGSFETADSIITPMAAKYDGENFYAIPDNPIVNMPNFLYINSFEKYNGELFMGGVSPDVNDTDLMYYHNGTWQQVGEGIQGLYTVIDHLTTFQGNLYAAGTIVEDEGNPGGGILKWNGESWSQIGGGIDGSAVTSIQKYNDVLIVSGDFDYAGDLYANGIAAWDGVKWCGLHIAGDLTANQRVPDMFVFDDTLYTPLRSTSAPFFSGTEIYKWTGGDDFGPCETPAAVAYPSLDPAISIFPNPTINHVLIQSDENIEKVFVMDLNGKILIDESINAYSVNLDVHYLSAGMYLLKLQTTAGNHLHKIIIGK